MASVNNNSSLFIFFIVISILVGLYCYNSPSSSPTLRPPIISGKYNDDLYTRGQIHYLSMDSGMKPCWNKTVKPLLQLTCGDINKKPKVALQLAFYMTSCFCQSIGMPQLACYDHDENDDFDREPNEDYDTYLKRCAIRKCLNRWNHDAFDSIYSRMYDLCYFFEYESEKNPEMKSRISYEELGRIKKVVQENPSKNWPGLHSLENILISEIISRQDEWEFWISEQVEVFWLGYETFKYKITTGVHRFEDFIFWLMRIYL